MTVHSFSKQYKRAMKAERSMSTTQKFDNVINIIHVHKHA